MSRVGLLLGEPFFYWRLEPVTASGTRDLLEHLGLDLAGRHVTDLGPGNGASLNVFREAGADTFFVERNPALCVYCRCRGFKGRYGDFVADTGPVDDIVYVRGSVGADTFRDAAGFAGWLDGLGGYKIVSPWLPGSPPDWFTGVLDERFERVSVLGYQTPLYPFTWIG